ncbi:MAG: carbohydrate binding family 9 domain-containing protein [Pseudomonadales bacterium]
MIEHRQYSLLLLLMYLHGMLYAEEVRPSAGRAQSLTVRQASTPPVIDGVIAEKVWQQAAVGDRFWMQLEQQWPAEQTEVLVLADGEYLYIAFRCYDSQPELIEATQLRRDKGLGFDDQVVVELDPFHNHRAISKFLVNVKGTQGDLAGSGRANKIEWKGDWRAKTSLTSYGWSAEIAIPFSILNYQAGNTFGVNFKRYHHRTREWSVWADTGPQQKEEEMAHLKAMKLPEKTNVNPVTFMPYVLAGRNIPDKDGDLHDNYGTAGVDIRYQPKRHITGVVSLYPDFSQLESQVTNIDFSDNEKLVNDPRPFFQEGVSYFGGNRDLLHFYSTRVPDFNGGGKYFAQHGSLQLGALITQSQAERRDSVVRASYEIGSTNNLTGMLVATDRDELSNQLVMGRFDGRQPSGLSYGLETAFSNTDDFVTDDADIDQGGEAQIDLGWDGDYWWVSSSADYFDKEFFPANGLQNSDEIDTRGLSFSTGYYRNYTDSFLRQLDFSVAWNGRDTNAGLKQRRMWSSGGSVETKQQISVGLYYDQGDYRPLSDNGRGEYADFIRDDHFLTGTLDFNTRSNRFNYGVSYSEGDLGGDDYRYLYGYLKLAPTLRTSLQLTSERLENFGTFEQTTIQGTWDVTNNDGISFRYIDADGGEYNRLAYRRIVSKGVDVFAVYNKDLDTREEFSIKLLWTFK